MIWAKRDPPHETEADKCCEKDQQECQEIFVGLCENVEEDIHCPAKYKASDHSERVKEESQS